jgi:hypothetical protein
MHKRERYILQKTDVFMASLFLNNSNIYRVGRSIMDKMFFSMYRPSCPIEANVRPEKYWLVCAGLLANHLFNLNFIFLSKGVLAEAE